jgi:hypothetical protein
VNFQDALKYAITGDDIARQFFYMNPDSGMITVKRLLTQDTTTQYNVGLRHYDYIIVRGLFTAGAASKRPGQSGEIS